MNFGALQLIGRRRRNYQADERRGRNSIPYNRYQAFAVSRPVAPIRAKHPRPKPSAVEIRKVRLEGGGLVESHERFFVPSEYKKRLAAAEPCFREFRLDGERLLVSRQGFGMALEVEKRVPDRKPCFGEIRLDGTRFAEGYDGLIIALELPKHVTHAKPRFS